MVAKKTPKKIKTLPMKKLSRGKEKNVKGGAKPKSDFGDIRGESTDHDHSPLL